LVAAFQQVSAENTALSARLAENRTVRAPEYKFVSTPGATERDPCVYSVEETFTEKSSLEMLKVWTVPAQPAIKPSTPVKITFFDIKTNYTIGSFADLGRLNEEQKVEIEAWDFFSESSKSTKPLTTLHENARAIHTQLTRALEHVQDTRSRLEECRAHVARMNEDARALAALGTVFGPSKGTLKHLSAQFPAGITHAHLDSLCQWVQQRTGQIVTNPTQVYQATRDGWAAANWWAKGDLKPRLLLVARSTSGYLFGGFTATGFNKAQHGHYTQDNQAFLFTLVNPHAIAPTMLPSNGNAQAVYNNSGYLPTFGGGNDLYLCANCHTATSSYSSLPHCFTDSTGRGNSLFTGAQQLGTMAEIVAFTV